MEKPTIKDVARLAGVSFSTVSRVLNGKKNVQDIYVQKTMAAVRALNFKPNIAARIIRGQTGKLIGMLVPEIITPFFSRIVNGAATRAQELNQTILLKVSNRESDLERQCLEQFSELPIDGLIYSPLEMRETRREQSALCVPSVVVARRRAIAHTPHIYVDNFKSGYISTKYLARLGRKRICLVAGFWLPDTIRREALLHCAYDSGQSGAYSAYDRYLGYRKALAEDELPFDENLVHICGFDYESGHNAMKEIFEKMLDLDAVIAPNDMTAAGIMNFLKRQYIRIPESISVIGHGDALIPEVAEPPLTSIKQNPTEVGRRAVDAMNRLLRGETADDEVVDVSLSIRASTCQKHG